MQNPFKKQKEKPPYLERIDELEKVSIVRLKGKITHEMIPAIEARIQENRKAGSAIEKNVLIDYKLVEDVDSSTIAFHLHHFKEYREKGFKIGFIHLIVEMEVLVEMFNKEESFVVFATEAEAVRELNR